MNIDTVAGEATDLKGRVKQSLGEAVGDPELQRDGAADQLAGSVRKAFGALRDLVRAQPLAAAAIVAVVGFVLLGGRRGRARG